jgi:hypothetical protein
VRRAAALAASLALLGVGAGPAALARPRRPAPAAPAYAQAVRAAVDEHLEEMVGCIDAGKIRKGAPDVRLDVQVSILSDGAVLSARRDGHGPRGDDKAERCMLDKVRTWRFPPPPGQRTVAVEFPIVLSVVGPAGK